MSSEDSPVGIFYDDDGNVTICIPPALVIASAPIPGESEETS